MAKYRIEKDILGKVKVPADAYYGAETERTFENFMVYGLKVDQDLIKSYAIIKRSAALANMEIGKLDEKKGNAIVKACDEIISGKLADQFITEIFQAGAGTSTNMNLNEVIANRAIELLGGRKGNYKVVNPNDHVNMSQSTNDTYPSTMHLTVYRLLSTMLIPALAGLEAAFNKKAKEFANVTKIGRTHLQDAVPMTLGEEFSGYASSIGRQISNLKASADALLPLPMGGTAIGTGIESSKEYSKAVIAEINRYTKTKFKLAKNFYDIQQNQNEEEWVGSGLKNLSISLGKIASDMRLLASGPVAGFSDIILPSILPGSSIMPGKINPSMPEMLNMVCFDVIGCSTTIEHAAESGQLELNVFMPIISHKLIYSIKILTNAVNLFTKKCVVGIKANNERLSVNLERDISLATALAPYIGYGKASKIAEQARKEGKTIKQVCLEKKVMSPKELDRILNPRRLAKRR